MILVANPFQHIFHLANNRLGGHNLNLTTKAKYPAKELWADSNRDFYFKMLIFHISFIIFFSSLIHLSNNKQTSFKHLSLMGIT